MRGGELTGLKLQRIKLAAGGDVPWAQRAKFAWSVTHQGDLRTGIGEEREGRDGKRRERRKGRQSYSVQGGWLFCQSLTVWGRGTSMRAGDLTESYNICLEHSRRWDPSLAPLKLVKQYSLSRS